MRKTSEDVEMLDEYDFSKSIRNPYVQRFQKPNMVSLDEDVKAVFQDSDAVNAALRQLIKAARAVVPAELKAS
jgi:hypothetical protein